jgi:molybdate transport system permease protein
MAQSTLPLPQSRPARPLTTNKWTPKIWQLLSLPLLLFLILPLVAIVVRTPPETLIAGLRTPQVLQAITLSMFTTLVTVLIVAIFGTPVAYLLARYPFRLRRVVDTVLDLPMVLPPAVAGVALLMAFGRRGIFGSYFEMLGITIAFTQVAVILAQTFVAAPFYVKAAILGFSSIEPELEQAAALDGADGWQIFRFITLPLSWSALLSGMVMTWARALGEFGATIIFAGNYPGRTQTMPLAIYLGFELDLGVALTLSLILVGFSFLTLMIVKGMLHRDWQT